MKAIIGLGNPGPAYRRTRHNAGWFVLDELGDRWRAGTAVVARHSHIARVSVDGETILLVRPQTFMNESGKAVRGLIERDGLAVEDILVVYDDLDLPAGRIRVRPLGSAGGHRGILSIQGHLRDLARTLPRIRPETGDQIPFARIRVGIGRPPSGMETVEYVLQRFTPDEVTVLSPAIARAADAVAEWVREGIASVMNRYNAVDPPRTTPVAVGPSPVVAGEPQPPLTP